MHLITVQDFLMVDFKAGPKLEGEIEYRVNLWIW